MQFRVVARGANGEIKIQNYKSERELTLRHVKIGVEDCSTDLTLRGLPVFRGLIGPMPDGEEASRYETPEIFEELTKRWSAPKRKRRKHENLETI